MTDPQPFTGPARVLMVGAESWDEFPGGLNRYLLALRSAVARRSLPVKLVTLSPRSGKRAARRDRASAGSSLPRRLLAMRSAAIHAGRDATVVDAHFAMYALLPVLTSRLRRLPLVVHFQGPWASESEASGSSAALALACKGWVERTVYRRARIVVVLSKAFGQLVVDEYNVDPARVRVIAPGVDLDSFTVGDKDASRERIGLPSDAFVAVSVRRLDRRMGLSNLVSVWEQVQQVHPDALLLIGGSGPEEAALRAQIDRLSNPAGVRLLGRVPDDELKHLYRAADCSVVPTASLEGFGLVTLESLACGTAPIVTDVGGLPDAVRDLDPSLVVPADDPSAMAQRILLAAEGALPDQAACRAHAQRFSWDDVAAEHVKLYEQASARQPLSVVYLDHTAALSGGELALSRLLPALDGVDARAIVAESGDLVERLRDTGVITDELLLPTASRSLRRDQVNLSRLPVRSALATASYVVQLAARLRDLRPDLVHTNSLKSAVYGGVAGRLTGTPVVWHIRDRIAPDYLPAGAVKLVRTLARVLPTGVIANSETTLETLGKLPIPTAVVPSPIDPALLTRERPHRQGEPFTAIMVGRLAPWKGQDLFLRAFARAFPNGPERAIVVGGALFGETEYEAQLHALAEELGLSGRVEFTGHVNDVAAQLDRADVLTHASVLAEPFGLVVVEAMAAGLPVIAANSGGPSEVITDGIDGLLYPTSDEKALAELLRRAASDPEGLGQQAERGRATAAQFDPKEVAATVEAFYRDLLRSHKMSQ